MKKVSTLIGLFLLITPLSGLPGDFKTTKPLPPFSIWLEPVVQPKSSGPLDLRLEVSLRFELECDEVTITVTPLYNLVYIGERSWVATVKKDEPVSYILRVIIPPNDTSGIEIMVDGGGCGSHYASNHFVTTGDTVEVYPGNPRHRSGIPEISKTTDPIWDTLSDSQLQTEYDVLLDLRDSSHLKSAEQVLGPLKDSSIFEGHEGYYRLRITLEKLIKITDEGIKGEFVTPPPWDRRYRPAKDSLPDQKAGTVYGVPEQSETLIRRVTVPRPKIDISLEPIDKTSNGGPMDFRLTIAPEKPAKEIEVKVRVSGNVVYDGETRWVEEAKDRLEFVYPVHFTIPRNDTSYVTIQVVARNPLMLAKPIYTIVTTGDALEVFIRRPGNIPSPPQPKTNDPIRDTLTQEQLRTEYEVWLDLRDSTHMEIAEKILGPLSDSAKSKGREGFYTLQITLENLIKLADEGIEFGFTTPPPWDPKYSPSRDSLPDKQSEKDSLKKQGALNKKLSPTSPDGISLAGCPSNCP